MSPNFEGVAGRVSANEYSCAHGTQINFGDRIPYLTYDFYNRHNIFLYQSGGFRGTVFRSIHLWGWSILYPHRWILLILLTLPGTGICGNDEPVLGPPPFSWLFSWGVDWGGSYVGSRLCPHHTQHDCRIVSLTKCRAIHFADYLTHGFFLYCKYSIFSTCIYSVG
jgi:hypothetical protein